MSSTEKDPYLNPFGWPKFQLEEFFRVSQEYPGGNQYRFAPQSSSPPLGKPEEERRKAVA